MSRLQVGKRVKFSVAISPTKAEFGPLLFAGDIESGTKAASQLGFDGVELSIWDPGKFNIKQMINLLKTHKLEVSALATGQSFCNEGISLASEKKEIRKACIRRLKEIIDLATCFDTGVIIGGIRGRIKGDDEENSVAIEQARREDAVLAVRECVSYAETKGVMLLLEPINRYETNFINTLDEAVEIVRTIGSKNLKILPDTFHMNIEEISIEGSVIKAGDSISYIHFADSNRLAPGQGHIDFKKIIAALGQVRYSGFICAEILPKPDDLVAARFAMKYFKMLTCVQ